MGLDDIKRDDFGEEDYTYVGPKPETDKVEINGIPEKIGRWCGGIALLAITGTFVSGLGILSVMGWQWVMNR